MDHFFVAKRIENVGKKKSVFLARSLVSPTWKQDVYRAGGSTQGGFQPLPLRIVCGINSSKIQQRLLAEKEPTRQNSGPGSKNGNCY